MENEWKFSSILDIEQEVFGLLSIFWRVCWNCILRVHRNTLQETKDFSKHTLFQYFWRTNETFSKSCLNGFVKNKNCRFERVFLAHFFKVILLIFFGPWPKVSRGFVRKNSASLSKLDSQFQKKLSGEFFFSANFIICYFRLKIEQKFFGYLSVKVPRGFQAAFYLSMGTIWRKVSWRVFATFVDRFFSNFFFHFWTLSGFFDQFLQEK